jgi:hypothetical protein
MMDRPEDRMADEYPFVIRAAGEPAFLRHVSTFIDRNEAHFTPNNVDPERRKWLRLDGDDPLIDAKKRDLVAQFAIADSIPDPTFNDLIGWISEGGSVHPHKDPASDGRMHVRINMLVDKPDAGCVPTFDGIPVDVDVGDAWLCFASHCMHATTAVVGKKRRSILSYGLQVDQRAAFGMFSRYMAWRIAHGAP